VPVSVSSKMTLMTVVKQGMIKWKKMTDRESYLAILFTGDLRAITLFVSYDDIIRKEVLPQCP
jgi:hypothetical protein